MGETFYAAYRWAYRPGKLLTTLSQPFPPVHTYAERIADTLQVARSSDDLAHGKTICMLCDRALAALPPRDVFIEGVDDIPRAALLLRRALKNVRRETQHYLDAHQQPEKKQKGEYDVRASETPAPIIPQHPVITVFNQAKEKADAQRKRKSG